jgi:glutamate/tyrosine decarboxylase-like PLP-dependent enzyme
MESPILQRTLEIANKYLEADITEPVAHYKTPDELHEAMDLLIGAEGMDEKRYFDLLEKVILATPKTASISFFNQLFGGRNMVAVGAEMLTAVTNTSMYTYKVGGVQILIEQEVVEQMLAKVGFDRGEGIFAPGGSMTNMIAMAVARNEIGNDIRHEGFDGRKYIVYTSEEAHYSIEKNAGFIGIGRNNVRLIPSDSIGKMRTDLLREEIERDLDRGNVPCFINATAGTTVLGAFDPFQEIYEIAEEYGIWFHVDAAFGGSVLLSEEHRKVMKGSELADSFSWNAHKMMGVPLTASVIMFREKGVMKRCFAETADYLFQSDEEELNPGIHSIQCGRRNDALKVWAVWKFLGHGGLQKRINKMFALTRYAVNCVRRDPDFRLVQEPELTTVCFEVLDKSSEAICEYLYKHSLLKVSYGHAKDVTFVRLVCSNPDMEEMHIDRFFSLVKQAIYEMEGVSMKVNA